MKVLAVYNIKGGVGKTSTAVNLAWYASSQGQRVLLWDLDPQGASTYCLQVKPGKRPDRLLRGKVDAERIVKSTLYDNLDLLPSDFSMRHADLLLHGMNKSQQRLQKILAPLSHDYDLVIMDCPPGFTLLSEAIFHAADLLIVPTLPSVLSLRMLKQVIDFKKEHSIGKLRIRAFLNMVDRRKKLHLHIHGQRHRIGKQMMKTSIPYASAVEQMAERRQPLPEFNHLAPAAMAYGVLWAEIWEAIPGGLKSRHNSK